MANRRIIIGSSLAWVHYCDRRAINPQGVNGDAVDRRLFREVIIDPVRNVPPGI
jgi:hypothetical protein